jgi:hypothetical protein
MGALGRYSNWITWSTSDLPRSRVLSALGIPPEMETVVKDEVLRQALSKVTKVLVDPRLRPDQSDRLRKAKRELEKSMQSGRVDERRLFRAVEIVATILLEIVKDEAVAR